MTEFNIEQARFNMVEQQIRPWDVLDHTVLDLFENTPRERFVPPRYAKLAFADIEIPLGKNQAMMTPKVEARMLQALAIHKSDKIMEIGTGSGFVTACLARLGHHVDSVDIYQEFIDSALKILTEIEIDNVALTTGDAIEGWNPGERYDVIAVTGSIPEYRSVFEDSLNVGGRLFIVIGEHPVMEAMLVLKNSEREFIRKSLFETKLPPLVNAVKTPTFML